MSFVTLIANAGYNISHSHWERISAMQQITYWEYKRNIEYLLANKETDNSVRGGDQHTLDKGDDAQGDKNILNKEFLP